MSLSQKNLSSIQKAGQAVHGASETIAATVRTQAESMVASMAATPFSLESEQAIARFKTLSKLSQGLATVEAQLQELYAVACDLANPASDVIVLPSSTQHKSLADAAAVDVVAKPAKAAKKPAAKKDGRKAVALTANDSKLLQYLQGALKAGAWTALTGAEMAKASGMPLGSVGLSLKKVIASGAVKLGERGMYQLAAAAAAPAAKEVKPKPVKKAVAAPAKKSKAPVARKSKPTVAAAAVAPAAEPAAVEADAAPL